MRKLPIYQEQLVNESFAPGDQFTKNGKQYLVTDIKVAGQSVVIRPSVGQSYVLDASINKFDTVQLTDKEKRYADEISEIVKEHGPNKIKVIKELRENHDLGLKEAKEIAESYHVFKD